MPRPALDPIFRSARRESLTVVAIWISATIWCVSYCYRNGYAHNAEQLQQMAAELQFVLGFPSWVFWGIIVPWMVCLMLSTWFAFYYMEDSPLGDDESDEEVADAQ
jgi:hypothetical protein